LGAHADHVFGELGQFSLVEFAITIGVEGHGALDESLGRDLATTRPTGRATRSAGAPTRSTRSTRSTLATGPESLSRPRTPLPATRSSGRATRSSGLATRSFGATPRSATKSTTSFPLGRRWGTKLFLVDPPILVGVECEQRGRCVLDLFGAQGMVAILVECLAELVRRRRSARLATRSSGRATRSSGKATRSSGKATRSSALPWRLGQGSRGNGHGRGHRQQRRPHGDPFHCLFSSGNAPPVVPVRGRCRSGTCTIGETMPRH
jgi:hypothetical protein